MNRTKEERTVSVPRELLQDLVDTIDLEERESANANLMSKDRDERDRGFYRTVEASKQANRAARNLLLYLRYTHHVVPREHVLAPDSEIRLDPEQA